jgi:hypothetical protein
MAPTAHTTTATSRQGLRSEIIDEIPRYQERDGEVPGVARAPDLYPLSLGRVVPVEAVAAVFNIAVTLLPEAVSK